MNGEGSSRKWFWSEFYAMVVKFWSWRFDTHASGVDSQCTFQQEGIQTMLMLFNLSSRENKHTEHSLNAFCNILHISLQRTTLGEHSLANLYLSHKLTKPQEKKKPRDFNSAMSKLQFWCNWSSYTENNHFRYLPWGRKIVVCNILIFQV